MATYYDTLLECKSNSPAITKNRSKRHHQKNLKYIHLMQRDGVYYFESDRWSIACMILVELSIEYPDEIFEARIWNLDMYASELRTIMYKAGIPEIIKIEPNYGFRTAHLEKIMGKETIDRFMKIAIRYLKTYDNLANTLEFDEVLKKEKEDKIDSFTTIHVENEKFKIEATKRTYSLIEVKGYHKEVPEPSWKEIEEEKK